ncbi:signal peptidase complex catalytic subunit SEC11A-like isoform X2 [Canna indica]|uniref:Signal peptidase complex catalytic subunit SEC11 n=1 Tax=Canna indica TaxID=4628 RepID=A0AAQ3QIS0_9LILI|nr:signal peptidase complex catalytic subunit SEC11A-like isoform X2 [Canna indica]
MGWVANIFDSLRSLKIQQALTQSVSLGVIITWALMIWKCLIGLTGSESPVVVVLSGSMEPAFHRGDILFLNMGKDPIRAGEIIVFNFDKKKIPVVHRVIQLHEQRDTGDIYIITKGDNNDIDDRGLYAEDGHLWLQQHHIMGRAVGFLPYAGWITIILTEMPVVKYLLIGVLCLMVITSENRSLNISTK